MNPKLYWIRKQSAGGVAISARPRGADWLEDEIAGWRKQGVDVVVSLLTDSENEELGLTDEAEFAAQKGITFYSFPIEDRGVPSSFAETERIVAQLASQIQRGRNVAIHCRQGIGRSALVLAAVLMASGEEFEHALRDIREVRGVNVPETSEQKKWLAEFAKGHAPDLVRKDR